MKWLLLLLPALLFASCAPTTPDDRIAANPSKYEPLSSKHKQLVREGRIDTGMPPDAVELAWGRPSRRYEGDDGQARTARWDYAGSRPVVTNQFYGGYTYGRYRRYGYAFGPEVTYVPYRRASVWFRNDRVTKWEESR